MTTDDWDEDFKKLTEPQRMETLQKALKELAKRIAVLENMNIQHQISSLNESLLETQRMLAHCFILQVSSTMESSARIQKPRTFIHFLEQLNIDTSSYVEKTKTSTEPLDVVREFTGKACKDARDLGIQLLMF